MGDARPSTRLQPTPLRGAGEAQQCWVTGFRYPFALAIAALVSFSCTRDSTDVPVGAATVSSVAPVTADFLGRWRIAWMPGYVSEDLRGSEAESGGTLLLHFYQSTNVGDREFDMTGRLKGDSIVIDGGQTKSSLFFDSLRLDTSGSEPVLVPTPDATPQLGYKNAP